MRVFLYILFFLNAFAFSQTLELGPMSRNFGIKNNVATKSNNAIDSSFVYALDTISLPFFDDFSTNKFQNYTADFTTPALTNQLYYQLLDPASLIPYPAGTVFTDQPTFKRTYDFNSDTYLDTIFDPISVKLGNFTSYPIQYETIDVYPPFYIYDTLGVADVSDTIWLENPTYKDDDDDKKGGSQFKLIEYNK